jgi:hypothetical protein
MLIIEEYFIFDVWKMKNFQHIWDFLIIIFLLHGINYREYNSMILS